MKATVCLIHDVDRIRIVRNGWRMIGKLQLKSQEVVGAERISDENERLNSVFFSIEEEDSACSDSIEVLQDDGVHDDELKVTLGNLIRMGAQSQIWNSKFVAFNMVIGYVTTYSTYARFCHFLDIYGFMFIPVFFVCMLFVGLPLVYLEMALGQFTTMDAVFVFKRMAPIASGLGVSMLLLSLVVTVMDYSLLFTLFTVLGNSVQIYTNEMPWHRCSNKGDGQTCKSMVKCPQQYEDIFFDENSQDGFDNALEVSDQRFRLQDFGGQCVRTEFMLNTHESMNILPYVVIANHRPTQTFLLNNIGIENIIPSFGFPSVNDTLISFVSWLLLLALSMQTIILFFRMCILSTILFNSIMITVLVVMLLSKLDAFVTVTSQTSLGPEVWAAAVLLTLNTLRIGHGGLFFLGSQNKFSNNLFVDAIAVVVYIFAAISLYSTAHVLFRATGGLYSFGGSVEDYAAHLDERRKERLYSQFFSYWTTAGDLIVYGSFEPFLQLALSLACTVIVIVNNVLNIETIVANCVTALDSLSDEASKKAIRTVSTFFLALCSFFLNSKVGFNVAVTIENTVIPVATACLVLIELFIIGVLYGFSRVCADFLSMNSDKISVVIAFPYPPLSMEIISICIIAFIILPTLFIGTLVVIREKHKMGNLRFLLMADYNLWGPRMTDDRMKATRMEKELAIRRYW